LQTLTQIKALLEERGLRPNKSLGQNFLCDHNLLRRLVEASGAEPGDLVLEVGPGTGTLTESLLERGCKVIACEVDRGLAALLADRLDRFGERVDLISGDCLAGKRSINHAVLERLQGRPFRLVANLPYGVASPLMALLATDHHPRIASERPACMGQFVTVQQEVADRLSAGPGSKEFGELGVVVQAMCEVSNVATLGPECFWPRPKVSSRMVAIVPRERPMIEEPSVLVNACRMLLGQRRKQIGGILAREAPWVLSRLPKGVEPTMRAEALRVEQFVEMARAIARSES